MNSMRNISVFSKDFDARVQFPVYDGEKPIDLSQWNVKLFAESSQLISEDSNLVSKIGKGTYFFDYKTNLFGRWRELFLELKGTISGTGEEFFYAHLFKPLPPQIYPIIFKLRNQIDKAMKSVPRPIDELFKPDDSISAVDKVQNSLPFGYDDVHCVLYIELGLTLINIVPPYTAFTIDSFPIQTAGMLLIDAATIVALESQGLFSVDTDFDYSLGGKSITIRHADGISGFLRDIAERFNNFVRMFKSLYRTKGTVMVQVPFGWGFGRFLSVVPTGWFARFGIGVTRQY